MTAVRPLAALAAATFALFPLVAAAPAAAAPAAAAGALLYTKTVVYVPTVVGPANDTRCTVVGNLYRPAGVDAAHPAPAIMMTNGFGGSKDSGGYKGNDSAAQFFAKQGYVTLSYSGLGFGGSDCNIELDDPDWDGKAGSQLISFLGGSLTGSSTKNGPGDVTVDYVQKDSTDHAGVARTDDPRVGMIGLSYGGAVQFSIAKLDKRLDTIVPQITWNDLSYSLAPNNTSQTVDPRSGQPTVTYTTPGTEKLDWTTLFFALGITELEKYPNSSRPPSTCPAFDSRACTAKAELDATGYPGATTLSLARHASVTSFVDDVTIPTFLSQGQSDTLFNLQEAAATYHALKARDVPVKMLWQQWGHSTDVAAPGELDFAKAPSATFLGQRYSDWMDHYLRGTDADTGPEFEYYRDWVTGYTGTAAPAYGAASSYPTGSTQRLLLSGSNAMVPAGSPVAAGSAPFAVPAAGAPTSYTETSAVDQNQPVRDAPGTFAAFSTAPLAADYDLVGSPSVDLHLTAPTYAASQLGGPAGQLVLFAKLYDVAPDGTTIVLPHRLIAPVRVTDVTQPVHIELPGVVHRFPAGHVLRLVVAAGDTAYKGNNTPGEVSVDTSATAPGSLALPVLSEGALQIGAGPAPEVPEAPVAALLPLVAVLITGGVAVRSRRSVTPV
jgi:ABC-2 type transport system ATP-binding protein